MIQSFPHFGIHVADLDRAQRFYIDGLGFERCETGRAEGLGTLLGVPGAAALTQFVQHSGGIRIELWTIEGASSEGDGSPRPGHMRGRPHLCFVVEDLDETARRIVEFGGQTLDETRCDLGYGHLMFCADPDGTRIELIRIKQAWPGYENGR